MASVCILRYGHDDETTRAISSACDLRVIWGGDRTVARIRSIPLPPHAREVTFADRNSFAAISASRYLELAPQQRRALANKLYGDVYSFDQMACSSPRLLVWIGGDEQCGAAARDLFTLLADAVAGRGYDLPPSVRQQRLAFTHRAVIDRPVTACDLYGDDLVVLRLESLAGLDRSHCGAGLLFQFYAESLDEIAAFVNRQDQTLAHFGFPASELMALAARLGGRGLDRMVPVGRALHFNRYWDGYDLFQEMTRTIYIETESVAEGQI